MLAGVGDRREFLLEWAAAASFMVGLELLLRQAAGLQLRLFCMSNACWTQDQDPFPHDCLLCMADQLLKA